MKKFIFILIGIFLAALLFIPICSAETLEWVEDIKDNPFTVWTEPYAEAMGGISYFYSFIFSIVGVGIYMHNRKLPLLVGYFLLVFLFAAVVFPPVLITILGLFAGLATTSLLYYALVVKRRDT